MPCSVEAKRFSVGVKVAVGLKFPFYLEPFMTPKEKATFHQLARLLAQHSAQTAGRNCDICRQALLWFYIRKNCSASCVQCGISSIGRASD